MSNGLWSMAGWVVAASILGFAISAVFAGWLKLSRSRFLIPYVLFVALFLYGFTVVNEVDLAIFFARNLPWGILVGGLVSLILIKTVRSQPLSRQVSGAALWFDLTWTGLVYGLIDGLFLNVMPVVAVWLGASSVAGAATLIGKIAVGTVGLIASLVVTLTYHLGYPEFRNQKVGMVLAGNSIITLAFLLSGSPLGSIISHTAMHVAAVLQGAETTIQLPPHYKDRAIETH